MKLLGWMHRKFNNGHNISSSTHPLPDFATGPTCNCLAGRPSTDDPRRHFVNPAPAGEDWMFQEPNLASPLMLQGLLAIGTFGSPVMMPTEELPAVEELQQIMEVEEIADKKMEETTENDLIVVKAELKKVLAAEEEKEMAAGDRISSASAVAGVKGDDMECPLQGFLFGLPVEMGLTALLAPESGHDRRASLGELFKRSRAEEELLPTEKREGLSAKGMNVKMKKMLKRRRTGRGNTGGRKYEDVESNKLFKILRIFHKKIHPEAAAESGKYARASQQEKEKVSINNYYNRKLLYDDGNRAQESSDEGEESVISIPNPQPSKSLYKNKSKNREHWIKTDTDYLVLEL